MSDLLTLTEHAAMRLSGELANLMSEIIGDGPTRNGDIAEAVQAIHVVQHMILSQAAARAYPDRYRLMGQTVAAAVPGASQEDTGG